MSHNERAPTRPHRARLCPLVAIRLITSSPRSGRPHASGAPRCCCR